MVDFSSAISQINNATSLDQIRQIVSQFSAEATGPGGVLYSGSVGDVKAGQAALQLANSQGLNIIDNTARGVFLSDGGVAQAIQDAAKSIFEAEGQTLDAAVQSAGNFLFGPAAGDAASLASSLWGQASSEFASSLSGDITFVGSLNEFRIFGQVEIPALLANSNVSSLGGIAIGDLAAPGADVIGALRTGFADALATGGLFKAADGAFVFSSEAAAALGLDTAGLSTAAELTATGFGRIATGEGISVAASLLGSAGSAAVDFLGSAVGGAIITLLTSATPTNGNEDALLAQMRDQTADIPASAGSSVPPAGSVTINPDGSVSIQMPSNGAGGDNLTLNVGPDGSAIALQVLNDAGANYNVKLNLNGAGDVNNAVVSGQKAELDINDTSISVGSGTSATVTGNDNTIGATDNGNSTLNVTGTGDTINSNGDTIDVGSGSTVTIEGDDNVCVADGDVTLTLSGIANALGLGSGSSATVTGNNNTVSMTDNSGSIVSVTGTGNTIDSNGNTIDFDGSGANLTVNGSGNDFDFTGANNDTLTINQTDLGTGVSQEIDNFTVNDSSATLTTVNFNFTDGTSGEQIFTNLQNGISEEFEDFSGQNQTGTLLDRGFDFTAGGSQIEFFNPSTGISTETDNYTGANLTGTLTSLDLNFTDGTSERQIFDPQSGVSEEFQDFGGANETGALLDQGFNFTAGGSQIEFFNPATGVLTETDNYTGADLTGTLTSLDLNFTDGTSELQNFTGLQAGQIEEFQDFSGANGTGTLLDRGFDFAAGGSQIEFFNPEDGVANETENFTGADLSGALTSALFNFTDGTSETQQFDPRTGVDADIKDFSGANGTGTELDELLDFTAGGSQFEEFNPQAGVVDEIFKFTGADLTGLEQSVVVNEATGFELEFDFHYSGTTETGYSESVFNSAGTEVWEGFFDPSGGYISGTGGYGGYGGYGGGGYGYGYGYGYFGSASSRSAQSGTDISKLGAGDSVHSTGHLDRVPPGLVEILSHSEGIHLPSGGNIGAIMAFERPGSGHETFDKSNLARIGAFQGLSPTGTAPSAPALAGGLTADPVEVGLNRLVQALAAFQSHAAETDSGEHLNHAALPTAPPIATPFHP